MLGNIMPGDGKDNSRLIFIESNISPTNTILLARITQFAAEEEYFVSDMHPGLSDEVKFDLSQLRSKSCAVLEKVVTEHLYQHVDSAIEKYEQREINKSSVNSMTFKYFSAVNTARAKELHNGSLDDWDLSQWYTASSGEMGELGEKILDLIKYYIAASAALGKAANNVKKINRIETNADVPLNQKESLEELKEQLGYEIADTVTYLFLLSEVAEVDLEKVVIEKFNQVSDRYGIDCKI